jgi:hypothetical protein
MPRWFPFTIDIAAIAVLVVALYYPRHRRKDLVVGFLALNVGVMAMTVALTSVNVGTGVGLGLFGVLSLIRLRSDEIAQQEVGYYVSAICLGLLGGVQLENDWLGPLLSAVVVLTMAVADHPRVLGGYRHLTLTIDRAFVEEAELRHHVGQLLGAPVSHLTVRRVDLVNDTTSIDVRYRPTMVPAPLAVSR